MSNDGGTIVVGPNFGGIDLDSLQVFCGTFLAYFQSLDANVQQFTFVDSNGNIIGSYNAGTLSMNGQ